jgi:putative transposase
MSHSYTNLLYHIVFATKNRLPQLDIELRPRLYNYLGGTIRGLGGMALEIGGVADHVHALVKMRQDIAISEFLQKLKANSSGWLNRSRRDKFAWQEGYAAFTVSESQVERVRRYISMQEEHHRKVTFADELMALLCAHHIDFNPEHL